MEGIPRGQKVLGVSFKNFTRWDFGFFTRIQWRWPAIVLRPIGAVLHREQVEVPTRLARDKVPIIEKISFGGVISVTAPEDRVGYKGRLFWANEGRLIYSKIRVKQGSLAVVPESLGAIAVSSEYPVYS